jgi:hypothetical protein
VNAASILGEKPSKPPKNTEKTQKQPCGLKSIGKKSLEVLRMVKRDELWQGIQLLKIVGLSFAGVAYFFALCLL